MQTFRIPLFSKRTNTHNPIAYKGDTERKTPLVHEYIHIKMGIPLYITLPTHSRIVDDDGVLVLNSNNKIRLQNIYM